MAQNAALATFRVTDCGFARAGWGASLSVRVFGSHGRNTMNFDTQTYIALIGAGSVFIVTIGVFAFLLTRKGK